MQSLVIILHAPPSNQANHTGKPHGDTACVPNVEKGNFTKVSNIQVPDSSTVIRLTPWVLS